MSDILEQLAQVLEARKEADPETSYVASLHQKGLNKILEKVGEECTETLLAAKDAEHSGETRDVVYETADLWFHSMVMLALAPRTSSTSSPADLTCLALKKKPPGISDPGNPEEGFRKPPEVAYNQP